MKLKKKKNACFLAYSKAGILYFAYKDPYSQSYGFSSSHVQVWELDHKETWVMLLNHSAGEDSWESIGLQEIKPSILKEIDPDYSL